MYNTGSSSFHIPKAMLAPERLLASGFPVNLISVPGMFYRNKKKASLSKHAAFSNFGLFVLSP